MAAQPLDTVRTRLEELVAVSRLLEGAERQQFRITADEYQRLVARVRQAFEGDLPSDAIRAISNAFPSAGEVYENLHYARSGLSMSPLERSVSSEMAASQALQRFTRGKRASESKKPNR
ncbi:MAG: hypothetical protein H0W40_03590 [Methylibium sp.]|uniref:hypothetical protein n=1 Tax=Methylibium sp. TaxID=2067992 RepID=UPI0017CAE6C5|nr:hypothetical protein [Methylibium sp.]MBA3596445.1 hypothetical protein [Methylibium sp.]